VNFQVTVLKILVSYPDGFAVMADLKRDMAILATSGRDWADRTKRLASRVADLDIFSQVLVERLNGGWRITDKGRAVLELMEARPSEAEAGRQAAGAEPPPTTPAPRLPASTRLGRDQRHQRRRAARERRLPDSSRAASAEPLIIRKTGNRLLKDVFLHPSSSYLAFRTPTEKGLEDAIRIAQPRDAVASSQRYRRGF
jgi:hypothetical protein